ncbi:MAG: hypothetical protein N3E51_04605 [Candidatus Micrarchaeota archaeon]|nr:hypothetical protein [Candidatus Micrarchaeota archaeon]
MALCFSSRLFSLPSLRQFGLALLFTLFLCRCAAAVQEVEEASLHNLAIAGSLLGGKNACGSAVRQPTLDDPFYSASIDAVALIPEADGATSDLSSPSLLWSWSADFPSSYSFALPPQADCPVGSYEIYAPGKPALADAKLEYRYGNRTAVVQLSGEGPNPVPLLLDSGSLSEQDYCSLRANLTILLSGKARLEYRYKQTEYARRCGQTGNYSGCWCEEKAEFGVRTYQKPLFDKRVFLVETGDSYELWLNPPLAGRLVGFQNAQVLLFFRRMPAKISAWEGGRLLGEVLPYRFNVSVGRCGEKAVRSFFEPNGSIFANKSQSPAFPHQLVEKNASYLAFYAAFGWNETAGEKNMVLEWEDFFSNRMNFSRRFYVRQPAAFHPDAQGATAIRRAGKEKTAAAYPARVQPEPVADWSLLGALFSLLLAGGAVWVARLQSRLK